MRYLPPLLARTVQFFHISRDKSLLGTRSARRSASFGHYSSKALSSWSPIETQDGTFTFYSEEFNQTFHNVRQGAKVEAISKFVKATDLVSVSSRRGEIKLLDICYGLGYNTAAAIDAIWHANPHCDVKLYALELEPSVPLSAIHPQMLRQWSSKTQIILTSLAHQQRIKEGNDTGGSIDARLLLGDARTTIQTLVEQDFEADAIFLDPFSPRTCPQLWSVEFLGMVGKCLCPGGAISTYSFSASVRKALLECGLEIRSIPPDNVDSPQNFSNQLQYKRKKREWSQGTVATWTMKELIGSKELSQMEEEHLKTRAAIPFRDPTLSDIASVILARQQQEQQKSCLESTTQWFKRWGMK